MRAGEVVFVGLRQARGGVNGVDDTNGRYMGCGRPDIAGDDSVNGP